MKDVCDGTTCLRRIVNHIVGGIVVDIVHGPGVETAAASGVIFYHRCRVIDGDLDSLEFLACGTLLHGKFRRAAADEVDGREIAHVQNTRRRFHTPLYRVVGAYGEFVLHIAHILAEG